MADIKPGTRYVGLAGAFTVTHAHHLAPEQAMVVMTHDESGAEVRTIVTSTLYGKWAE